MMKKCMELDISALIIYVADKILIRICKIAKIIDKNRKKNPEKELEDFEILILECILFWKENFYKTDMRYLTQYNKINFINFPKKTKFFGNVELGKSIFEAKEEKKENKENIAGQTAEVVLEKSNFQNKEYSKEKYCNFFKYYNNLTFLYVFSNLNIKNITNFL